MVLREGGLIIDNPFKEPGDGKHIFQAVLTSMARHNRFEEPIKRNLLKFLYSLKSQVLFKKRQSIMGKLNMFEFKQITISLNPLAERDNKS